MVYKLLYFDYISLYLVLLHNKIIKNHKKIKLKVII